MHHNEKFWLILKFESFIYPVKGCWQGQQRGSHGELLWAGAVLRVKQGRSEPRARRSGRRAARPCEHLFHQSPKTSSTRFQQRGQTQKHIKGQKGVLADKLSKETCYHCSTKSNLKCQCRLHDWWRDINNKGRAVICGEKRQRIFCKHNFALKK